MISKNRNPNAKHANADISLVLQKVIQTRDLLLCFLDGHKGAVNDIAVTPDGRYAISASDDHTLKVWDLGSIEHIKLSHTLSGHTGSVNSVATMKDGNIVSASDDCTRGMGRQNQYQVMGKICWKWLYEGAQ